MHSSKLANGAHHKLLQDAYRKLLYGAHQNLLQDDEHLSHLG